MKLSDFNFLLKIGDVYCDSRKGMTVVTGIINTGRIAKDDKIYLISDGEPKQLVCHGVEINRKITNVGSEGDNVGLLFEYISPSYIKVGDYLAKFSEQKLEVNNSIKIQMKKIGGIYYIPCTINGINMDAVFDTGASEISLSLTEAMFMLKQGKLDEKDFIGTEDYTIADGSIHKGSVVILREVILGDKVLIDVKASIVDNHEAPVLFGQSALSKIGKITIDYSNNMLVLD